MRKLVLPALLLLLLNGCWSVGPDYVRPEVETPAAWRFEEKEVRDLANTAWWEQFNDPALKALVTEALSGNSDIRIATARIEEYFGRYFSTRGDQFPFASAGGSASRQQVSEASRFGGAGGSNPYSEYEVSLGASWEIDFWGKYRRASEAARAQMLATEEARRNVVLTLVTAIAATYVDLCALDKQLAITRQTVASRKATLDLFTMRFKQGVTSELDLSQIESQYEDAMARVPEYEAAIARTENTLSILLGRNPGPVQRSQTIDQLALPPVPAGVPSDVLARRPDILLAEQNLIAANASIGAAKSAYFPSISLTAALGSVSTDLSDLFTGPAEAWSVAAPITLPIFSAGRIGGQVKAAEALQVQALEGYRQTIQNAFRETEDALIGRAKSQQRLEALGRQLKALRNYARLAKMRYEGGYTSYLEVLDAERSLFNVELAYATAQDDLFRALIGVYKAMGGGWVALAEERIPVQPEKEAGFIP